MHLTQEFMNNQIHNYFCFLSTTSTQSNDAPCFRFLALLLLPLSQSISMTSTSEFSGLVGGVFCFFEAVDGAELDERLKKA